jgi:hypothetical protein
VFVESGDGLAEGVAAGWPRVERRAGDPDAAGGVEGDVEGFLDLGLVGDELDFETGWEMEEGLGLGGGEEGRGEGVAAGIGGVGEGCEKQEEEEMERTRKGETEGRGDWGGHKGNRGKRGLENWGVQVGMSAQKFRIILR